MSDETEQKNEEKAQPEFDPGKVEQKLITEEQALGLTLGEARRMLATGQAEDVQHVMDELLAEAPMETIPRMEDRRSLAEKIAFKMLDAQDGDIILMLLPPDMDPQHAARLARLISVTQAKLGKELIMLMLYPGVDFVKVNNEMISDLLRKRVEKTMEENKMLKAKIEELLAAGATAPKPAG